MAEVVSMQGQWKGLYGKVGSYDKSGLYDEGGGGRIMVNIDETVNAYRIDIYIQPYSNKYQNLFTEMETEDKSLKQTVIATLYLVDPETLEKSTWEEVKQHHDKDSVYPDTSAVELELKDNTLYIHSVSKTGGNIASPLEKVNKDDPSKIPKNVKSWDEFKDIVSKMEGSNHLFRGQQQPWKLSTAFHRGERYVLGEFLDNDVHQLHNRLSAITKHYFDLYKGQEVGAFINLLQHHGYPTPFLDWSYSPYVAAFFAFRGLPLGYKEEEEKVRIYIFDNEAWQRKYKQVSILNSPFMYLSVMEFVSIDNPRVIPQQAVTTMTNIADIEAFILERQAIDDIEYLSVIDDIEYLSVIDIPASERDAAMRDLRFMGITAGSMFPDIDGACEEFKERNFKV